MNLSPTSKRTLAAALLLALATLPCFARTANPSATQTTAQTAARTAARTAAQATPPRTQRSPRASKQSSTLSNALPGPAAPGPAAPPTGPLNRTVIVLDPAHGGIDNGSRIGDSTLEKNVTLALALRLRSLLAARGFTVVMTRDSDVAVEPGPLAAPLTLDDRAGLANHERAVACLTLHATGSGQGVHLYSSELSPAPAEAAVLPWLTAQAAWVPQSEDLEHRLGDALTRAGIPLVLSTASVRPVDSLTCPAVVVELAPESDKPASINGSGYQERVAQAIAAAVVFWKDADQPPVRLASPANGSSTPGSATSANPPSNSPISAGGEGQP